jgi:hypothetical protein
LHRYVGRCGTIFFCDASEKFRNIHLKKQYENLATSFLDETFVLWYPSVTKTLAKRGAKTVKAVTPNEKLASTALLVGCIHMTWKKVKGGWIPNIVHASNDPPFLIFKASHATIDSGLDAAGEHATCTPSAWINAEVFKKWINIRFPVRPKEKAAKMRGWIILDVFKAHIDASVVAMLKERGLRLSLTVQRAATMIAFDQVKT